MNNSTNFQPQDVTVGLTGNRNSSSLDVQYGVPVIMPMEMKYFVIERIVDNTSISLTNMSRMVLCGRSFVCCEKPSACNNKMKVLMMATLLVFIGLATLVGNLLLPLVLWKRKSMRTQLNWIKASLAVADSLVSVLIFSSILPNMLQFSHMTYDEMSSFVIKIDDTHTLQAMICGSIFNISIIGSIIHLLVMSADRLYAFKYPLSHRDRGKRSLQVIIGSIWISTLMVSLYPLILSSSFIYTLSHVTFSYNLMPANDDVMSVSIYVTLLLPYVIMILLNILTAIVVWQRLQSSSRLRSTRRKNQGQRTILHTQLTIVQTIAIMMLGFTITILPYMVVQFLYHFDILNCDSYSVYYLTTFMLALSSGWINPAIYIVRDPSMRRSIKSIICGRGHINSNTQSSYVSTSRNASGSGR